MLERLIYQILKDGVASFVARADDVVMEFVQQHRLEKAESAIIHKILKESPPTVQHGYARTDAKFPLFAIILAGEMEEKQVLGDEGLRTETIGGGWPRETLVSFWTHNFDVLVYGRHPDVVIYLYQIAKNILVEARDVFKEEGIINVKFSGSDIEPDAKLMPEFLFARRLTVSVDARYLVALPSTGPAVRGVEGIFREDMPGGVTTPKSPESGSSA